MTPALTITFRMPEDNYLIISNFLDILHKSDEMLRAAANYLMRRIAAKHIN
jgi:hypothetical protein